MAVVKAFHAEDRFHRRFDASNQRFQIDAPAVQARVPLISGFGNRFIDGDGGVAVVRGQACVEWRRRIDR